MRELGSLELVQALLLKP